MSTEYLCQTFLKMRSTCNTRSSSSRFQLPLPKTNYGKKRSDLRWKQGPAEKVVGLHELKRSVWRNRLFLFNIFATENRIDYDSFTFKTLSNLKLLSQLTQARTVKFNHHADFSQGSRGLTIISLHFPISKLRACDYMISDASQGSSFWIAGHLKMPNRSLLNY